MALKRNGWQLMNAMAKVLIFIGGLAVCCALAGMYGFLHDQVSWTVSAEYFERFKFIQFSIPSEFRNRWGAGIVGFRATWWMGLALALLLNPLGLAIRDWRTYREALLKAYLAAALTAMILGSAALIYGLAAYDAAHLPSRYFYPEGLIQSARFAAVGTMHNMGYLGGLCGVLVGFAVIVRAWRKENQNSNRG